MVVAFLVGYPVRKQYQQSSVQMTFPSVAEEDLEDSLLETSPQKPSRKLLPDRTRAARDKANKKIVEFIVKTKGAEEHLLAILKCRKESRWMKDFLSSRQYGTCIETYLEDEEQLELVVNYLKEVAYHEVDTAHLHRLRGDGVKFILDVLLPEVSKRETPNKENVKVDNVTLSSLTSGMFRGGVLEPTYCPEWC